MVKNLELMHKSSKHKWFIPTLWSNGSYHWVGTNLASLHLFEWLQVNFNLFIYYIQDFGWFNQWPQDLAIEVVNASNTILYQTLWCKGKSSCLWTCLEEKCVLALIHLNGDVCLLLNGDSLFVQGYSCRKENLHFNLKDSTMEPRLFQNMQIATTSTPTSCWCHHCV